MPIWSVRPVTQHPELYLRSWSIRETDAGTRHFVGWNLDDDEGRVSSAILEFDPVARRGVTKSGRVYELVGNPGFNADAEHVWQGWQRVNGVVSSRDVTRELIENNSAEGA